MTSFNARLQLSKEWFGRNVVYLRSYWEAFGKGHREAFICYFVPTRLFVTLSLTHTITRSLIRGIFVRHVNEIFSYHLIAKVEK